MQTTSPDRQESEERVGGRATAEGTRRFAERHGTALSDDFFRPIDRGAVLASSIGLGTYLGECDTEDDTRYVAVIERALASGINLIDTAINYRCQRSERATGRALRAALRSGTVARDEVIVCTKGGYIPLDGEPPATREEYAAYVANEYVRTGLLAPEELIGGGHAIAPAFLADQIARSRANLGVATIDVYYVHNPEQQLDAISAEELRVRLRATFAMLEERCAAGEIARYGCATWNGLRAAPDTRGHLGLAELVAIAAEVAGDAHHFRVVQLPINLAMNEAVRIPTQPLPGGQLVSLLQCASELGVSVVASATLWQAKLTTGLPAQLREALPGMTSDAQRAIAFVRSLPVVTSALVGMKSEAHLLENLGAAARG